MSWRPRYTLPSRPALRELRRRPSDPPARMLPRTRGFFAVQAVSHAVEAMSNAVRSDRVD